MWPAFIGSIAPVSFFYLIYYRHFRMYYRRSGIKPNYHKLAESFLSGIVLALLVYLAGPMLDRFVPWDTVPANSFIKAALVEKTGALFFIWFIHRKYPGFSIFEGIVAGVFVGTGFALVENSLYALKFGEQVLIARTLFSTPLHITTCGIIGHYLARRTYFSQPVYRISNLIKALVLPVALHGLFDYLLMSGGDALKGVGPLLFSMVILLEFRLAGSKLVPAYETLRAGRRDFQEWLMVLRQPRYERWIQRSMGAPGTEPIPLFRDNYGTVKIMLIALFTLAAAAGTLAGESITRAVGITLTADERFLLMIVFPVSAGLTLLAVGALNPSFLKNSVIRIPIIFDSVLVETEIQETVVTFDICPTHCFLRTSEPLGADSVFFLRFEGRDFSSPGIRVSVAWENHSPGDLPRGTIVRFDWAPRSFMIFLIRYGLFRYARGIAFNLRLPGSELIRRLFMRPATVMQKEIVLRAGAVLFREGEEGNSFYFIKRGRIELFKTLGSGERIIVDTLDSGHIFNEMAMLGTSARTVSAVCTEDAVLAVGDLGSLSALIGNSPDFALALIQKLTERVDNSQKALIENIEHLRGLYDRSVASHHASVVLLLAGLGLAPVKGVITAPVDPESAGVLAGANRVAVMDYLRAAIEEAAPVHTGADTRSEAHARELERAFSEITVRLSIPGITPPGSG
jgi:protease PrsW